MPIFFFILLLVFVSCTPPQLSCALNRRILHQPFFPLDSFPPTQPPSTSPQSQQQPKLPSSSSSSSSSSSTNKQPFFPSYPSPPPPTAASLATFPANISSLIFPQTPGRKPLSPKLVAVTVLFSLLSIAFITVFVVLVYRRRRRNFSIDKTTRSDSYRLFPGNAAPSDAHHKVRSVSATSSEFLYLGTLVNSRGIEGDADADVAAAAAASPYRKLGSPELYPLPPLSRQNFRQNCGNASSSSSGDGDGDGDGDEEEEEFYSPRSSSGRKESPSSSQRVSQSVPAENIESKSSNSTTPSYPSSNSASPTPSISNSASPSVSLKSKSPDSVAKLPPPPPRPMIPSPAANTQLSSPSPSASSSPERCSEKTSHSPAAAARNSLEKNLLSPPRNSNVSLQSPVKPFSIPAPPPPPPPPPPPRFWETTIIRPATREQPVWTPQPFIPSRPVDFQNPTFLSPTELPQISDTGEKNEETPKPKLKPLHWDKVRASSDRAMVWDQLKSSSFQLNEEMIETLFVVNNSNFTPKEMIRRPVLPSPTQENRVLDPKKSQNISILLRAVNVTIEEVCEALWEGNTDTLGTELLESLSKMAPTKEEERKLKEYKDDSPYKLGPAERFLKAVLDIPFAFKRVDAMLYMTNFDSEVEYLRKSFETLEVACEELRNSRMFLKLLEAVLKTGNRMNVGTNRGDAHAFKLDTLLKLVDVKGTDGKTTLLHFVVQEITRAEGSRLSGANQSQTTGTTQPSTLRDDVECRKLGLQVVAGLCGELTNVKKAAAMDSDVLSSDVSKLARGLGNIGEVVRLNEAASLKESSRRFSDSMNGFLKKAEEEIIRIQAQESVALSLVKEITEYFHGNSTREEAHPFRIFMVVRDFLSILDRVCKEVGKINERTVVSSARQFPVPVNPTLPPVFPRFHARPQYSSSDDESSPS